MGVRVDFVVTFEFLYRLAPVHQSLYLVAHAVAGKSARATQA